MGRQLNFGRFGSFALLVFPFAVVFLFIPTELYYHNIYDWSGDAFLLKSIACAGLLATLIVGLLAICFERFFGCVFEKLYFWFFVVGIYLLFADVFAPLQLARLDGSVGLSNEPWMYTVIEVSLLLGVILFFRKFELHTHRKLCSVVAIFFIACFVAYFSYAAKVELPRQVQVGLISDLSGSVARKPNVYHIVLDEMQTDYMLEVLKGRGHKQSLKGFSLFKNNISNYPYTDVSAASYLTGTVFTTGSYLKWLAESDSSLLNAAARNGYGVHVYGKPALIHARSASSYAAQNDVLKRYSGFKHPLIKDFVRLWFARISPNFMTNAALGYGNVLGGTANDLIESSARMQPRTIEEGIEPYAGVFMFDDAIKTEKDRPGFSSYLYLHVLLPHGPYVLDDQCNYDPRVEEVAKLYLRQAECAVNKLDEFLTELDRLGRLENSIIIVQSDHGSGWAGFLEGNKQSGFYSSIAVESEPLPFDPSITPWSRQQLESRSMALLMIKPSGADKEFAVVGAETQLLDVYPTIAELAGIDIAGTRGGVSLANCFDVKMCDIQNGRSRFFYFFSAAGPVGGDYYKFKVGVSEQGRPRFEGVENAKIKVASVELGSVVSFSQSGFSDTYIGSGWSAQEGYHRWTDGPTAEINLPMNLPAGRSDLVLRVKAGGYPSREGPQQVGVFVNGVKVADWTLSALDWYEAMIPQDVLGDGRLHMVFKIKQPTAPCDVSESQDCRRLGMAVVELGITEKGGNR